ncbi:ABC transporter ATP-binding protein [Ilumatobacter nonamiensis]|uniref:ABC transporter ATP-binding protein n=1 Tax=Ilumatobacter nonamiensis TaxID=467093 RepID=UPI00034B20BD|nr:ABC transporter ATP-binding protein [Ilumatobacter nonamiensis]
MTIEQLTIAHDGAGELVQPIRDLDLTVRPGEFVLLHGPSGCGKTTLLSAVAGLLTPVSGSIRIGDVDVARLDGRDMLEHRRTTIGMVFQAFNLVPSLTAEENVAVPLRLAGHRRRHAATVACELLTRFGMGHRLHHRPGNLSGGQQQRVAFARAVATDPPIFLADEPTAHLDHTQVELVCATMREIADNGRIVIVATHDDRLRATADRIVELDAVEPSTNAHADHPTHGRTVAPAKVSA